MKEKGTVRKEYRIAGAYYLAECRKAKRCDKVTFTLIDTTNKINVTYKIEVDKKNRTGSIKITGSCAEKIYQIQSETEYLPLQNISHHFMETIKAGSDVIILIKRLISETEHFLYNYILWSYFA